MLSASGLTGASTSPCQHSRALSCVTSAQAGHHVASSSLLFCSVAMSTLIGKNPWVAMEDPEQIQIDTLIKNGNSILVVIECLGVSCKPVYNDMAGNLNKIKDAQQKLCPEVELLHELLAKEIAAGCHKKDPSACVGFLWLTRGIMYFHRVLKYLLEEKDDSNDSMQAIVSKSYNETLRQHHNFVMRGAFSVVSHASPKKSVLCLRLMENDESKKEALEQETREFVDAMVTTLDACNTLIANLGIN